MPRQAIRLRFGAGEGIRLLSFRAISGERLAGEQMTSTVAAEASCPWCGESVELVVDPSGGRAQRYVEDCWVCCHPCIVSVVFDEAGGPRVEMERE